MRVIFLSIIVILSSCSGGKKLKPKAVSLSPIEKPVRLNCDDKKDFQTLALVCVGDYIDGEDLGGVYEVCSPEGANIPSLDPNSGCFDSDDLDCDQGALFGIAYIVESATCENCADTTKVFFEICCLEADPICNE